MANRTPKLKHEALLKTREMATIILGKDAENAGRLRNMMRELREAALWYNSGRDGWEHFGCRCTTVNRRYRYKKSDGLAWAERTGRIVMV